MPESAVTICVEFRKIAYSISIPATVVVSHGDTILSNSDKVYIGDELTIYFDEPEHFNTEVKINNNKIESGKKYVVGSENVVIVCSQVQTEWQIYWFSGEEFEVEVRNGENRVKNGDWIANGIELSLSVSLKTPETHEITNIIINGNFYSSNEFKFTTSKEDTNIVVIVEKTEIEVKNDGGHAIVVGDRESVKETTLDVDIIEETEQSHADIVEKVELIKNNHNVKSLKAYSVRLLKENQPVTISNGVKLMLLLPEFYVENVTMLFRQSGENIVEQTYEIQSIGNKMYAVFNVSEFGIFAFANLEKKEQKTSSLNAGEIFAIAFVGCVFVGVGTMVSVAIVRKKKKLRKSESQK